MGPARERDPCLWAGMGVCMFLWVGVFACSYAVRVQVRCVGVGVYRQTPFVYFKLSVWAWVWVLIAVSVAVAWVANMAYAITTHAPMTHGP